MTKLSEAAWSDASTALNLIVDDWIPHRTVPDEAEWILDRSILGFGRGLKPVPAGVHEVPSLKVYVAEEGTARALSREIGFGLLLPGGVRTVPIDFRAVGKLIPQMNVERVRPAEPGFSIGPVGEAGTFGCVVEELAHPGIKCLLSNYHVLTASGQLPVDTPIFQPSPVDQPSTGNEIAVLRNWVEIDTESPGYPNKVDAAIARVLDPVSVTAAVHGLAIPTGVGSGIHPGMPVQIVGRTSEHQTGVIKDVNCCMTLDYPQPGGGTSRVGFRDQVLCSRYSKIGDSGSAVLDLNNNLVGLHFFGSEEWSLFNKIANVIDALKLWIVTA